MAILSKDCLQDRIDAWAATMPGGWTVRLFKNNLTPTPANVVGDFVESTFTGYAPQALAALGADTWDGVNYVWSKTAGTYNFSGAGVANENVYGYYVLDNTGKLIWSKRFAGAPLVCGVAGTTIQVIASIDDANHYSS